MSGHPDLSTLRKRMQYAADVLDEVGMKRYRDTHTAWASLDLRETARRWEAETAELACDIARARGCTAAFSDLEAWTQHECIEQAQRLIEYGWGKGDSA